MAPVLSLTPAEKLLRQCLLDCRSVMHSTPGMPDLVLRFTGGWVRDKLLSVQSHDIDVALSTMTGWGFGQALQVFMQEHGAKYEKEASHQGLNAELKNLHKIEANPDKSKHLETMTTRMFGIDVDFVNLRKEIYDDNSRNPQMEFGTPEEDALRRDATVNALFYNLDSQEVEDFTKRGLEDMEQKIIRTPLVPYQTFKDDPLRVLRLIRFACRLGYQIEASAQEAMKDKTIHKALQDKISRERVGVEMGKIMAGPDPYTGLKYVNEFDLYHTVFDGSSPKSSCPDSDKALAAYDGLRRILEERSTICLGLRPKENQALSWFLAAYVPWAQAESKAAEVACREGIKATNTMSRVLKEAIDRRAGITKAVELVHTEKASRADVGMTLRKCKESWRSHILYSLLCDIADSNFHHATSRYEKLVVYIHDHNLEDAHKMVPVLKGNEIRDALDVSKAGKWLSVAVDMVAEWQFNQENPTRDQAIEMITARKTDLGLG